MFVFVPVGVFLHFEWSVDDVFVFVPVGVFLHYEWSVDDVFVFVWERQPGSVTLLRCTLPVLVSDLDQG